MRVVDCLALGHARPLLARLVVGVEGHVDMDVELIVRFDYGSIVPWVRRVDDRWRAVAGPDGLELCSPVRLHGRGQTSGGEFTVAAGEEVSFVLGWFPSHAPRHVPADASELIAKTDATWSQWSARCAYSGEWREPVLRSLLTLEALTFEPTGGIVAAPTTSLPESLGGTRNWDYRYCWMRDATLTLEAFLIGGYQSEALRWREWLLRAVAGDPTTLQTMYGVAGERRLTELELDWLPGYAASQPVRTGNGAHEQLQLDVYGELLDVLWQAARAGTPPSANSWSMARLLLDVLEDLWREPDEGIWEVRGGRRHFTHSKVLCWVAFDRAIAMVEQAGYDGPVDRWRAIRDEIHAEVCTQGYNADVGAFTQCFGGRELDASVLMIPLVGFLPGDDPRVRSTIAAIRRDLTHDGLVSRYDPADRERRRHRRTGGRLPPVQLLDGGSHGSGRRARRGAGVVRAASRARERPRAVRRGVRPEGRADARQLPAGVHASRVGRGGAHARAGSFAELPPPPRLQPLRSNRRGDRPGIVVS